MLSFAVSALSLNLSPAVSRSANPVMAWQPMRGSAPLADQALALDADTKDAIIELGLVREVRVPARAENLASDKACVLDADGEVFSWSGARSGRVDRAIAEEVSALFEPISRATPALQAYQNARFQ